MKPENLNRLRSAFASSLQARGAVRGFRAENKASVGELWIYDVIGRDMWTGEGVAASDVAARLEEMKGCKALNIYINSPGGSVWDGKAIHAQLSRFAAQKTVYVDGIAASAASFIAMAGDRIVTAPGATWMIHEAMGGAFGNAGDLEDTAAVLRMETRNIAGLYEKRTGCSLDECLRMMSDETWMDADKARELGFTDEIAEGGAAAPAASARAEAGVLAALDVTQARISDLKRARLLDRLSQHRNAASRGADRASPGQTNYAGKDKNP